MEAYHAGIVRLALATIGNQYVFPYGAQVVSIINAISALRGAVGGGNDVGITRNGTLQLEGSIFTNLTVKQISARPVDDPKNPVERIDIERVHLEYSIPSLIKHGPGEFLRSYSIQNADLVFSGIPSESAS